MRTLSPLLPSLLLLLLPFHFTPALTCNTNTDPDPDSACALIPPAIPAFAARAAATNTNTNTTGAETYLNLTAVTARGGVSTLACWRLATPFAVSDVPGVAGTLTLGLGDLANATYTVLPPRFDAGLHHAPVKQYVWFISGLAHVSLPNATGEVWIYGGRYGLVYADDTADVSGWGHVTQYPGNDETIGLAIPVKDGVNPKHAVLHDGPCEADELSNV